MNVIIPKPFTEQATSYQHCEPPSAVYAVSSQTVEVAMANLCGQHLPSKTKGHETSFFLVCLHIELHYSTLMASVEHEMSLF